jgi:Cu2+-containing amine oxidase
MTDQRLTPERLAELTKRLDTDAEFYANSGYVEKEDFREVALLETTRALIKAFEREREENDRSRYVVVHKQLLAQLNEQVVTLREDARVLRATVDAAIGYRRSAYTRNRDGEVAEAMLDRSLAVVKERKL